MIIDLMNTFRMWKKPVDTEWFKLWKKENKQWKQTLEKVVEDWTKNTRSHCFEVEKVNEVTKYAHL